MKKKFFFLFFLLLPGCPRPALLAGPAPEPAALLQQARAAHALPQTLTCDAKAFVEAPKNGGRYALHISIRRPASVRIEALTPLGDPAAVLVADGGRFALLDLRNGVFYKGPATPANLSRLIPAPLRDEELVSLISGAIPELPDGVAQAAKRQGDGYLLTIASPRSEQEVELGGDLRVLAVRRTRQGSLLWSVKLDEHDDSSGVQLPRLIHLDAPLGDEKVDLRLRDILTGRPPPQGAFLLGVPQGMRVEEVQ